MQDRRTILISGLLFGAASAAPLPLAGANRHPVVRRHGKFFLVNGWVLTDDDVRALATRAP